MGVVSEIGILLSAIRRRSKKAPLRTPRSAMEASEVEHYGEMRPPWVLFPNYNPHSLGFRMGPGEDYAAAYWDWWRTVSRFMTERDRLAYISRWPGRAQWTGIKIEMIWNAKIETGRDRDPALRARWFAKGERVGLPSLAQCDADYDPTDGRSPS